MMLSLHIYTSNLEASALPVSAWGPLFLFNINSGETMKELNFHEKKKIRNRLLAIYRETGKVTERELLRLSALTGIAYATIVEIHKAIHYRIPHRLNDNSNDKMASSK